MYAWEFIVLNCGDVLRSGLGMYCTRVWRCIVCKFGNVLKDDLEMYRVGACGLRVGGFIVCRCGDALDALHEALGM